MQQFHDSEIDDLFDACLLNEKIPYDRPMLAREFYDRRAKFKRHDQDPVANAQKEHLSKLACVLDPTKELYWSKWAEDLSNFDEGRRRQLIDDVDTLLEILPAVQQKNECRAKFYTDFIGKDDVSKMAGTYAAKKAAAAPPSIIPKGQDVYQVICQYVEQAPNLKEEDREKNALLLNKELNAIKMPENPMMAATMHVSVAYIASNNKQLVNTAKKMVSTTAMMPAEKKEVLDTVKLLRDQCEDKSSAFYLGATEMLSLKGRKSPPGMSPS